MRTLNEILVEMKALVEELETHIGTPKTMKSDLLDEQFVFAGSMDDNMSFNMGAAQSTFRIDDNISLYEIDKIAR
jgi:hypothetical protein